MRFHLRTLLIVLTLGPPMLAGAWLGASWLSREGHVWVLIPIGLYLALVALAANLKRIVRFVVLRLI
jgi:hypothetical protein